MVHRTAKAESCRHRLVRWLDDRFVGRSSATDQISSLSNFKSSMSGAKICVVDDDTSVLRSLKELLASDDLDAERFDDPGKFLDYLRGQYVRLAVLDVWTPPQSGIRVQERLHHLYPQTREIFISIRDEPATRALALDGGAFAFLSKPLDDEGFLASVHAALGK